MLKKILIVLGSIIGLVIILVIVAGILIRVIVNKEFVETQISKVLNRQVQIEKIDVSIFSLVSGIEIDKVAISNFKTPEQLAALKGKPVAAGDIFAGMEALRFKVKFLPLFRKQLELKELVLYRPLINVAKNKQGVLNCDDLIKSGKGGKEDKDAAKKEKIKEPAKTITADDLPVAIAVGEIGIKDGTINYYDGANDQKFQIYRLTTLAYDIDIDPKDLQNNDLVKLKIALGIKTVGAMKTGSVQSFDIFIDGSGRVIPFDLKTRKLDPEIILHVAFPDGSITGLQIFNSVASIPLLGDYLGQHISFLKGKQEWKNSKASFLDLRYKDNKAEITNGKFDLQEAVLGFAGSMNTETKALDMNVDMLMKKEINDAVKADLAKRIDAAIKNPDVKKYVDVNKLAEAAMQPLLNKDGMIDLKMKIGGTTKKPETRLTEPKLDSLDSVVKKSAGSILQEAGKGAAKQLLKDDGKKLLEGVPGLFKK
jgi:AsmA family